MFTTQNKRVIVSVINDLATDARVKKTCDELVGLGFEVILVGRKLRNSTEIVGWSFKTKRMHLLFTKGVFFYLFFNIRLFFILLFSKSDLFFSNDLDTLLPNYLVSKLKGIPLIYDSHELFCEVPELQKTPFKKKIWESLERMIVPKLKYCITVNQSIATIFEKKYKVKFTVTRNIPIPTNLENPKSREDLHIDSKKKMILMQGAGINMDRGAEELVLAMKHVEDAVLYIIGSGDVWNNLKLLITENKLESKVVLISKLPKQALMNYTRYAHLGISIDKNTNLNYLYSLPNKLFDYIHADVPVLASRMVEVEEIIKKYDIGCFIDSHEPNHIAQRITQALNSDHYSRWKQNSVVAKKALTWEEERKGLINLVQSIKE